MERKSNEFERQTKNAAVIIIRFAEEVKETGEEEWEEWPKDASSDC